MRLTLALAILLIGLLASFSDLKPDLAGLDDFAGMFLVVMGAVQIAFIASGNFMRVTPPALEPYFKNEGLVLWIFAPCVALAAIVIGLLWSLIKGV